MITLMLFYLFTVSKSSRDLALHEPWEMWWEYSQSRFNSPMSHKNKQTKRAPKARHYKVSESLKKDNFPQFD